MWIYAVAAFTIFLSGKKAERWLFGFCVLVCRVHFVVQEKGGLHDEAVTTKSHLLNAPKRSY